MGRKLTVIGVPDTFTGKAVQSLLGSVGLDSSFEQALSAQNLMENPRLSAKLFFRDTAIEISRYAGMFRNRFAPRDAVHVAVVRHPFDIALDLWNSGLLNSEPGLEDARMSLMEVKVLKRFTPQVFREVAPRDELGRVVYQIVGYKAFQVGVETFRLDQIVSSESHFDGFAKAALLFEEHGLAADWALPGLKSLKSVKGGEHVRKMSMEGLMEKLFDHPHWFHLAFLSSEWGYADDVQ
jgi:hypothetical protein